MPFFTILSIFIVVLSVPLMGLHLIRKNWLLFFMHLFCVMLMIPSFISGVIIEIYFIGLITLNIVLVLCILYKYGRKYINYRKNKMTLEQKKRE